MPDKKKRNGYGKANTNLFPVHVLPPTFKKLVVELNSTLKFPIDYTGTALLTAMSTSIGTTAKVIVKDGWYEYGSLYTCIVGNAGANKSHPIAMIFKPIKDLDKLSHDDFELKVKEYNAYMKLSQRNREGIMPVPEPILRKMVLTNFTPEVLSKRLNENSHGCTIVSDELATFFGQMNNYSKGDNSSSYLSYWSNQSITVDRMGKQIPLFIERPFLSIIGGLQPRKLNKVFHSDNLDSGFFQRFLFAYPQETYKEAINDNLLDHEVIQEYSDFIKKYLKQNNEAKQKTRELNWTTQAKSYFYQWQSNNCDLVNRHQDSLHGEIINKFDNHFVRLSLILQIMEDPNSTEIGVKAVKGANALCKYYMSCAFKVLEKIQNPMSYLNQLPEIKKQFYRTLKSHFMTSDAIELGKRLGFQERSLKGFLQDRKLFKRLKHGHYEKIINT